MPDDFEFMILMISNHLSLTYTAEYKNPNFPHMLWVLPKNVAISLMFSCLNSSGPHSNMSGCTGNGNWVIVKPPRKSVAPSHALTHPDTRIRIIKEKLCVRKYTVTPEVQVLWSTLCPSLYECVGEKNLLPRLLLVKRHSDNGMYRYMWACVCAFLFRRLDATAVSVFM